MRDPDVIYAGYKIPHPLEHVMLISVQTTPNSDPVKAFRIALRSLMLEFDTFKKSFTVCFCILSFMFLSASSKLCYCCIFIFFCLFVCSVQDQLRDKGMLEEER